MPDDESAEVTDPSDGSFDDPAVTVSPQLSSVLGRLPFPSAAMRTAELKALRTKFCSKRIAVVGSVRDDWDRTVFRTFEFGEDGRRNFDLSSATRRGPACKWNSFAICHHQPLCTFSTFGRAHVVAPFLQTKSWYRRRSAPS